MRRGEGVGLRRGGGVGGAARRRLLVDSRLLRTLGGPGANTGRTVRAVGVAAAHRVGLLSVRTAGEPHRRGHEPGAARERRRVGGEHRRPRHAARRLELAGELVARLEAVGRVGRAGPGEPRVEARGEPGVGRRGDRRRVEAHLLHEVAEGGGGVRELAGGGDEGAGREAPEVGVLVGHAAREELLGAHERGRPEGARPAPSGGAASLGRRRALDLHRRVALQEHLRDAEVDELHHLRVVLLGRVGVRDEHDVLGLHVAVDDAQPVRLLQRVRGLRHQMDHLGQRERAPLLDHPGEAQALEVLHHEVGEAAGGEAVVVDVDGVARLEPRHHPRLGLEARHRVVVLRVLGPDELDRHPRPEREVDPLPHRAHAPRRDGPHHAVLPADHLAREGRLRGALGLHLRDLRPGLEIEVAGPRRHHAVPLARVEAAHGGRQPLLEVLEVHRLGDVVVGAGLEGREDVVALGLRGEEDDVAVGAVVLLAERAAHLDAVHPRHHPVEHDDLGGVLVLEDLPGFEAVGGHDDVIPPPLQVDAEELAGDPVVVGREDAHASSHALTNGSACPEV